MVILDFDQRVERIVLGNPVVRRLKRKRKQPRAFVLDRQIDGLL